MQPAAGTLCAARSVTRAGKQLSGASPVMNCSQVESRMHNRQRLCSPSAPSGRRGSVPCKATAFAANPRMQDGNTRQHRRDHCCIKLTDSNRVCVCADQSAAFRRRSSRHAIDPRRRAAAGSIARRGCQCPELRSAVLSVLSHPLLRLLSKFAGPILLHRQSVSRATHRSTIAQMRPSNFSLLLLHCRFVRSLFTQAAARMMSQSASLPLPPLPLLPLLCWTSTGLISTPLRSRHWIPRLSFL